MILDILPLAGGTARLVRVYGGEPCVKLPGAVPAPEGEGRWPITELGDYCFSEKPRGLPGPEKTCRYERAEDGKLCLTRAFGRDVSGKERYSFDFDAPAAPAQDDELHPICGNFLEEVTLPESLRVIGSTFYNCRRLRRLTAGTGELTMGSDVFLNCFALEDLIIRATPEQATGLFALVGSITEAVRALFWPVGEAAPRAGLWYPAYWEDIEETPAHILLHTFSGQGYHYRQCFLENKLLPAEYDAIFPQGHDADDASVMAMLCFDRLRWPWQLSDAARDAYRDFLKTNTGRVLTRLLKAQDTEGIKVLLALDVMDTDAFAEGAALAAKADNAEAAALLADALAVQAAGAFAVVLECVPPKLAALVTRKLDIITIGIGAGAGCDGQVLVWQDMLGLNGDKVPKFVRCFAPVGQTMTQAFRAYDREVKAGAFPAVGETYAQSDCGDDVLARLEQNNAAFPAAVI